MMDFLIPLSALTDHDLSVIWWGAVIVGTSFILSSLTVDFFILLFKVVKHRKELRARFLNWFHEFGSRNVVRSVDESVKEESHD